MTEHPSVPRNCDAESDPAKYSSPGAALISNTGCNYVFRSASILCAILQILLYFRHVFILYPPHGDFSLATVLAVLPALALQIVGCACALGAGTHRISCMIWNIAITTICLLLLFTV